MSGILYLPIGNPHVSGCALHSQESGVLPAVLVASLFGGAICES